MSQSRRWSANYKGQEVETAGLFSLASSISQSYIDVWSRTFSATRLDDVLFKSCFHSVNLRTIVFYNEQINSFQRQIVQLFHHSQMHVDTVLSYYFFGADTVSLSLQSFGLLLDPFL